MKPLAAILVLKLFSLVGSLALTAAFIGLFAFRETLGPHLLTLLIVGLVTIAIGEGGSWLLTKRLERE